MLTTSLKRLFNLGSWVYETKQFHALMNHFGKNYLTIDDAPISFELITRITDIEFAIDCTSSRPDQHKVWRSFSVWCCQPFISFITVPSCLDALKVAEDFVNGLATTDRLSAAHEKAYLDRFGTGASVTSLEDLANSLSCHSCNPNFEQSINECFNGYALGMGRLGMSISRAEELQSNKFLELVC